MFWNLYYKIAKVTTVHDLVKKEFRLRGLSLKDPSFDKCVVKLIHSKEHKYLIGNIYHAQFASVSKRLRNQGVSK